MTIYCFAGPSLPTVPTVPAGMVLLDPVGHGALLRLPLGDGDVVAIIDGLFYTNPAIRHREIIDAMARGAAVVGGASMGALRAAELHEFGMVGVGRVFELYASGALDADDEVAVLHADADTGHRPLSVALVSLREAARELLTPDAAEALVTEVGRWFFADRDLRRIRALAETIVPAPAVAQLMARLDGTHPDVKQRDALLVVERAATMADATRPDFPWQTDNLVEWRHTFAPDIVARRASQLLDAGFPTRYAEIVTDRMAARWDCRRDSVAAEFAVRTGIHVVTPALAKQWLYPETTSLAALAVATYRDGPGLPVAGPPAPEMLALCERVAERNAALAASAPAAERPELAAPREVLRWVAALWSVPDDLEVIRRVGYTRGFRSCQDIYRTARQFLVLRDDE